VFVLHVKIKMKTGQGGASETVFAGPFKAAISAQAGFHDVQFLHSDDDGNYILSIAFENQQFQQQWVETDLHGKVWKQMEQHFASFTLNTFTAV
jgi:heme-degrading monooxygenase HmoA